MPIVTYQSIQRTAACLWNGSLFVDTTLPFWLRSAPKIFCAVSDALEWILYKEGISSCLHYIDDILIVGAPQSRQCSQNLSALMSTCARLGVRLASEKIEAPTTTLTFLGIEFDMEQMSMHLPQDKLEHIQSTVAQWLNRKAATKREMLSLIGELAHASKVVQSGRTFLRRLIDLAHSWPLLSHCIYINTDFKSDLLWWHLFLRKWNGLSLLATHLARTPSFTVMSDASGSWGCGAVWDSHWLQVPWTSAWEEVNIAAKELVPVVLAVGVWGSYWSNDHVLVHSDNMAVVEVRTSHNTLIMHKLRSLHFLCAIYTQH